MYKINNKGLATLLILLVAVVITGLLIVGYIVLNDNSSTKDSANNGTSGAKQTTAVDRIELLEASLPDGWAIEYQDSANVALKNITTSCSVNVGSTSDTLESNSPEVDQKQQTIDAIKSKGYDVNVLPSTKLDITTNNGLKTMDTLEFDVTGYDSPMSQSYGYIATEQRFTSVQVSCPDRSDLANAKQALKAIKVNF